MIRNDNWMLTASGRAMHLTDPDPDEISINDIAEALSKQARFNGQSPVFYSVAQHSVLVMSYLPAHAKPYGLLHDAHEAYIGDITSPVNDFFRKKYGYNIFSGLKKNLDEVIHNALGLDYPLHPNIAKLVQQADHKALATELRDVMNADQIDWPNKYEGAGERIQSMWGHQLAREKFLNAFWEACLISPPMMAAFERGGREARS